MNVFGVGPAELIVILIVALVFVGPERLPRMAADLARTIREIRKYTNSLASEFNEVVAEFEKETEAERGEWKEIGQGLSDATKELTTATQSVTHTLQDAQAAAAGNADAAANSDAAAHPTVGKPPVNGTAAPLANGTTEPAPPAVPAPPVASEEPR